MPNAFSSNSNEKCVCESRTVAPQGPPRDQHWIETDCHETCRIRATKTMFPLRRVFDILSEQVHKNALEKGDAQLLSVCQGSARLEPMSSKRCLQGKAHTILESRSSCMSCEHKTCGESLLGSTFETLLKVFLHVYPFLD